MISGKWIVCTLAIVLSASICARADDPAPATQPAAPHAGRLKKVTEPWSYLKDLTPEQTEQILKLHNDALIQEAKIKKKETDDIMAILTPAQVTELKLAEVKAREAAAERTKLRREKKPTTAPAE